jgi:hypothetical protein
VGRYETGDAGWVRGMDIRHPTVTHDPVFLRSVDPWTPIPVRYMVGGGHRKFRFENYPSRW